MSFIRPWPIYDEYLLLEEQNIVRRSNIPSGRQYDLVDSSTQSQLFKTFIQVKDADGVLAWIQQFGFPEDRELTESDTTNFAHLLSFSVSDFLAAVASTLWIKKFAETLSEAGEYGDVTQLKLWARHIQDFDQAVEFLPDSDLISAFRGVIGATSIPEVLRESIHVYTFDPLWDYKFSDEFIQQTVRDARARKTKVAVNLDAIEVTSHGKLTFLPSDGQLLDLAKEYLKLIFDELLQGIGPRFELQKDKQNRQSLLPVVSVSSPWSAINFALYNYIAGKTNLRKCRNPRCIVVEDGWAKQRHYCSEACQKSCERHGLKIRSNSPRSTASAAR